ncbi:lycopene epsilon cyclase, chloroplastic-like isoform X2 [Hevea brasiliensis]|uniref:lycopene epsilon cyclase, chloroplastic-like isoform X2 n=1 Tax=Hevea brasiliensis TaxID=3981 RepID=UPI0025EDE811|nr:lycopene epsilon cyclase, chloroplastic-like isoform X2 [Hevea brasiliensis]XP_058001949.1 lycopene epsilon cyclase, chloroplastic-like isoform X2 [Hevea brasiliensis]XP_058001951.1 lycopene epsilon cyclase, chloroplastic-like isoform X2 [Hevea brasiliensis]
MECLRARNFAAMAVFSCPSGRSRRRTLRTTKRGGLSEKRCRFYQVKASSAGSYSCVAIKEEFADEEDYVKAGGSELVFVQMQQDKAMKKQSNIAHKVSFSRSVEDLGLEGCIEHVWRDTIAYLDDDDPVLIGRAYGRVSGHLFHQELLRRCVESGVLYLRIIEAADGHSLVACEPDMLFPKGLPLLHLGQLRENYCSMKWGVLRFLSKQLMMWRSRWKTIHMILV